MIIIYQAISRSKYYLKHSRDDIKFHLPSVGVAILFVMVTVGFSWMVWDEINTEEPHWLGILIAIPMLIFSGLASKTLVIKSIRMLWMDYKKLFWVEHDDDPFDMHDGCNIPHEINKLRFRVRQLELQLSQSLEKNLNTINNLKIKTLTEWFQVPKGSTGTLVKVGKLYKVTWDLPHTEGRTHQIVDWFSEAEFREHLVEI